MKGNNSEEIGDVVGEFVGEEGVESGLNEYGVVDGWKDVVGGVIRG